MNEIEVIQETIARMEDDELLQRWQDGMFSDEAKPIVEMEFKKRNIDINNPAAFVSKSDERKQRKPVVLPALFAAISGTTTGAKFGALIAAALGAGAGALIFGAIGWRLGVAVAAASKSEQNQIARIIIPSAAVVGWFVLNAVVSNLAG